jgi:uncharacterized protein
MLSDRTTTPQSTSVPRSALFKKWLLRILIGYLCYAVLFYLAQRKLLFPGQFRPAPATFNGPGERLLIEIESAQVEVIYQPPLSANQQPPAPRSVPLLIYTHGNGELIDDWALEFQSLRHLGCAIALVEYPGYGRSTGKPSEAAISEVLLKTYDQLVQRPEIDPTRVIAHGRSLGGGGACILARERNIAALILESTFTSVRSYSSRYGLPSFLSSDPFDNQTVLATWQKPCLILHGTKDPVVPYYHAEQNAATCPTAKFITVPDAGHNDQPSIFTRYRTQVVEFLREQKLLATENQ